MASRAPNIRITQAQQPTAPSPAVSVPPKVTRPPPLCQNSNF